MTKWLATFTIEIVVDIY